MEVFGASLKSQTGSKDPESKKGLKGYSRLLITIFSEIFSDQENKFQSAIANHAIKIFLYLRNAANLKDVVRKEVIESNL